MNRRRIISARRRRGFAAIVAISLIILVASALAVLGAYFASEATRTRAHTADAQLRQLLITGAAVVLHRAESPAPDNAVPLPAELRATGASLSVELKGEGDQRSATIRAQLGDRRSEQTLRLKRSAGRWQVQ